VLTLVTLSMAGGIFIAVLNTRTSVLTEFGQILAMFGYDVQVVLNDPQQVSRLRREAMRVDGVTRVEGWGFASGIIIRPEDAVVPTAEAMMGPQRPRDRSGLSDTSATRDGDDFRAAAGHEFMQPTVIEGAGSARHGRYRARQKSSTLSPGSRIASASGSPRRTARWRWSAS
jgi:hypothetical protein